MTWGLFFQMAGIFVAVLFCLLCALFSILHLRDSQRARKWARSRPSGPAPVVIHLSLGDRLGDLPGAKKRARPIDEDILATIRQIEENR